MDSAYGPLLFCSKEIG